MATQGATLGRGTLHLPIWPLVAIVAGAAALMIGLTLIDAPRQSSSATIVTDVERFANSSAAVRERPDTLAPAVGISHVTPNATTTHMVGLENPAAVIATAPTYATGLENPGAYVAPAVGISHVTPNATTETFVGLENPGAYVAPSTSFATGLENPGAYVDEARVFANFANGLENPGAYPVTGSSDGTYVPKLGFRPGWGFEGNTSCGQCR